MRSALDLVYDRRREGYDPLTELMAMFEGVSAASSKESRAAELAKLPLLERLAQRIVDGERNGLEADLDEAMTQKPPLSIINDDLLTGMKTVGELFGSGQMQLPFVLQSAEVMKAAVAYLEPHMEKSDDDSGKGRIVLATVKGDVHDIGKNLVDIILSNNGYEVVNIGIKQPITTILEVAEDKSADVVGMSGLLVKSTVVMKENLQEMNTRGVAEKFPVLLGGAALTRGYVENDLAEIYEGEVHYARDAFEGLRLMDTIMTAKRGGAVDTDSPEAIAAREKEAERKARHARSKRIAAERKASETPVEVPARSDVAADVEVPVPPFWGSRIVKGVAVADYTSLLDERALFLGQWGLRGVRGGQARAHRTKSWWRPKGGRDCGTGWTGCPPTASSRMRRWCTATSRRCRRATTSSCSPSRTRCARTRSGSPSRVSSAAGSCASPTSSGPASWRPSAARLMCCRSSW